MEELEIARRDNVVVRDPSNVVLTDDPLAKLMENDSDDEYSLPPMVAVGIAAIPSISPTYSKPADDGAGDLWAGHDDDDEVEEEFVCSVHGANPRICKRGICKERSDHEKKKIRAEKEQQREQDKKSKSRSKNRSNSSGNWHKKASRSRSHSETVRSGSTSSRAAPAEEESGVSVWD